MAYGYDELQREIGKGQLVPVYLLYGEEGYFIDKITAQLELAALAGAEPSFNLDVVYGSETSGAALVAAARSFPVMAARRLVLVKEANKLKKDDTEKLASYLEQPNPQTVLVLQHRSKDTPDKRTRYGKLISAAKGIAVMESKPLRDYKMAPWIEGEIKRRNATADADAVAILVQHLGTNLLRIEQELDKLMLGLADTPKRHIDKRLVYDSVNIDREFNVFELRDLIGERKVAQAHHTLEQLLKNTKGGGQAIPVVASISKYLTDLGVLHYNKVSNEANIATTLGINPFFAKKYVGALRNYSYRQVLNGLQAAHEADLALKGISGTGTDDMHVLKTLLWRVMQT